MKRRQFSFHFSLPQPEFAFDWRAWLPSRGNVLFTLVMIAVLLWAQSAGAVSLLAPRNLQLASTGTIAYQGRLADSSGNPLTSTLNMSFRLYNAATGGAALWTEQWTGPNGVKVSDGLFNVMLGSLTPIPQNVITGNSNLFLGITVGTDDEMAPRVQLGSVPFAVQALSVPDGSITAAKLAPDVSLVPPTGSITTTMLANGAVTQAKLHLDSLGVGTTQPGSKVELEDMQANHLALTIENADTRAGIELENQGATQLGEGIMNLGIGTNRGILPKGDNSNGAWFRIDTRSSGGFYWFWRNPPNGSDRVLMSLDASGNFGVSGTKSSVVQTTDHGIRKLYAVEAPDVRFSDEGMAHLLDGQGRVELEPIFLETIEGDYLIQITPYGDASLYVAEIGVDYFVVKAREGDPNVSFAWRLSATRRGYAGVRLEEVEGLDHEGAK